MAEADENRGRATRQTRPRDRLGRPLPYGVAGVPAQPTSASRTPSEALDEAQRLLDAGLPFHAHEVLEDAWKGAPPQDRDFWRGLAQLAVGITHAERGNQRGASVLLRRGAELLTPSGPRSPYGVDVAGLAGWSERTVAEIDRGLAVSEPLRLRASR